MSQSRVAGFGSQKPPLTLTAEQKLCAGSFVGWVSMDEQLLRVQRGSFSQCLLNFLSHAVLHFGNLNVELFKMNNVCLVLILFYYSLATQFSFTFHCDDVRMFFCYMSGHTNR